MNSWAFLRSARWLLSLLLICLFTVLCHLLAQWQLARRAEAQAEIARVARNYDAPPVPIEQALPELSSYGLEQKWLPVRLTGRYDPAHEVLIRNRPCSGASGYDVLTPFVLSDGNAFFVDRGCVPAGSVANTPAPYSAVTTADQAIVVRLRASEPRVAGRVDTGATAGSIHLPDLANRVSAPTYTGAYGMLDSDESQLPPFAAPRPDPDEGPHLSYALQWYVFAVIAFVAYGWAARNERRNRRADAEPDSAAAASVESDAARLSARYGQAGAGGRRRTPRSASNREDDAVEDALIGTDPAH